MHTYAVIKNFLCAKKSTKNGRHLVESRDNEVLGNSKKGHCSVGSHAIKMD